MRVKETVSTILLIVHDFLVSSIVLFSALYLKNYVGKIKNFDKITKKDKLCNNSIS